MRFALISLAITMASASPVYKRQSVVSSAVETVSSVVESVITSVVPVPTAVASAVSSVTEDVDSAVSSAASSVSEVVSSAVASAAPSASASAAPLYTVLYPCPEGSELTYVEERTTFPGSIEQVSALTGFQNSTWYGVQPATDGSDSETVDIGAMRTVMFPGIDASIMEVLVNQTIDDETMAIEQTFNGTAAVTVGALTISAYSTVFQLYTNDTNTDDVTAKLFSNVCASPKEDANMALTQIFQAALAALAASAATPIAGAPSMSMSMSEMMSSMMPSMSASSMPIEGSVVPITSSVPIVSSIITNANEAASEISSALPLPTSA